MNEEYNIIEKLEVPSDFEHLGQVEGLIDRICAAHGVSEDDYGNVLIAVTEAFNNAIVHGHALDKGKNVGLVVSKGGTEICFSVTDSGKGFDFDNVDDPTAPANIEKENGRGIYLMRHLADRVEYEKDGREANMFFKLNG